MSEVYQIRGVKLPSARAASAYIIRPLSSLSPTFSALPTPPASPRIRSPLRTADCWTLNCRSTKGHHPRCSLRNGKLSAASVPVLNTSVDPCESGWRLLREDTSRGVQVHEMQVPLRVPKVRRKGKQQKFETVHATLRHSSMSMIDGSVSHMFWFEKIANRRTIGFEYFPISWREYPRGCVEFGPYRTFMMESLDGEDICCAVVQHGSGFRDVKMECARGFLAAPQNHFGDAVDEAVQKAWWSGTMASLNLVFKLLEA